MSNNWFENWFGSPYYPILYQKRNEAEAREFLEGLVKKLKPEPLATILDLACGRGRHTRYLNQMGFDVTGVDLSEESIAYALSKNEGSFYVHDMRALFRPIYFDYIFNLFTSFGYFDNRADHLKCVESIYNGLNEDGRLVIDFFNAEKTVKNLIPYEEKELSGIHFTIEKKIEGGRILKSIKIKDGAEEHFFEEQVYALTLEDFKSLFKGKLRIEQTYGDYQLNPFDSEQSDRLIIIANKINHF